MKRHGIARFVGRWVSSSGYHLQIKRVSNAQAMVDFVDDSGNPVRRPYMDGAPSVKMVAHYDDYNGQFEVDLWGEGKGFTLHLHHEADYELDEQGRESLVPSIGRHKRDRFLDRFYALFGSLDHFVRESDAEHRTAGPPRRAALPP